MDDDRPDKILDVDIEVEMKKSYIDYAMSVIASRALPDVRDGLKPVHRRILYSMNEMNLDPSKGYKKSARIVGDTMGKYHPHGNSSIYDSMVRMAQDFSMRYVLVAGHGNFGSMDGDPAAAERYTEAKLSYISTEMLKDIEKDTVEFMPTYDGESDEPLVLPSKFPNLLVNGSSGIAVGMSTNIPPHNLNEIIDGVIKLIDNYMENLDTDIEDLLKIIKGPDFPTGASILGKVGIKSSYRYGKGKIKVRGTAFIEPINDTRNRVVITELPYQVNKSKLVEKIGELVSHKKIEGISDIRDESDRNGISIIIELKRDVNSSVILNQLYKYTQLQESFGVIMLALVNNEPKCLNIKQILEYYLEHQKDVVTRRTIFNLNKAEARAHILEGYFIALDNIDEVISIIRASKDTKTAKATLMDKFNLSENQAEAIVEMRLRSLTGLEREKLDKEYKDLKNLIKDLQNILDDNNILYSIIKQELTIIKNKYGDERRTKILVDEGEIDLEDLIDDESSVITLSSFDYIKRIPLSTYKSQNRGGRGIVGMQMREKDIVKNLFVTNTHDHLLFFTSIGRVFQLKAYEIPEYGRNTKGVAIINFLNLKENEKISTIIPIREFNDNEFLVFITKKGMIKKTNLSLFKKINKSGIIAINFKDDDELVNVVKSNDNSYIFIATNQGLGIKFNESEIRASSRQTMGVRGIRLNSNDFVIGGDVIEQDCKILFVTERGYGKCTGQKKIKVSHRGGKGIKIYRITDKTGCIISLSKVNDNEEVMLINQYGVIIRIRINDISTVGRITSGVKLINLSENNKVIGIAKIDESKIQDSIDDFEID